MKHILSSTALFSSIIFFLISCQETKEVMNKTHFKFVLTDSIKINLIGDIRIYDYNIVKKRYLFMNKSTKTVFQTDAKGNIISQFSVDEGDKGYSNKRINNIGYIGDSLIAMTTPKGIFLVDDNGNIKKHLKQEFNSLRTDIKSSIKEFMFQGHPFIACVYSFNFNISKLKHKDLRNEEFYHNFRHITFCDLKNDTCIIKIPYEPNSLFMKFDYYYEHSFTFYDYNSFDSSLYILHTPDPTILVYSAKDSFKLTKSIPIRSDYFKITEKSPFKEDKNYNSDKFLMVNSGFTGVHALENMIITTYHTGIPEDKFENVYSLTDINKLFAQYEKLYAQVFIDGEKQGADIPIPYNEYSIAIATSQDHIVMYPYSLRIERPNYSVFNIYRLSKVNEN